MNISDARATSSGRFKLAKRLLPAAIALTLAWVFLPWAVYQIRQMLVQSEWEASNKRWDENDKKDRLAWRVLNPGKEYPSRGPLPIAILPRPVVDAWYSNVLLDDGTVLTESDVLDLHLGEAASLPPVPLSARLLQLPLRTRAGMFSNGAITIDQQLGASALSLGDEDPVTQRRRYNSLQGLPRPELGGLNALTDAVAVTAGESSAHYILRRNGQVHALGKDNTLGQLGPQRTGPDGVPGFVMGDAAAIAAGRAHALALKRDGSVWTWGNETPPIGPMRALPAEAHRPEPRLVPLPARATQIAAGYMASFALLEDGTVWGWGNPECAALGVSAPELPPEAFDEPGPTYLPDAPNSSQPQLKPRRIEGPTDVVDFQVLGYLAIALPRDGRLWGWGLNDRGQIGTAEYTERKYTGYCNAGGVLSSYNLSLPRLAHGVTEVKQAFLVPGATALIKGDNQLWYLGEGCMLCSLNYHVAEHRAAKWGLLAAKAMWCGKVAEVTALRKAVDAAHFAQFPKVTHRGRAALEFRELFRLRFRSVAQTAYLSGYDEETRELREHHKPGQWPRVYSAQAPVWFDALDLGRRDPAWQHLPGWFNAPDRRRYEAGATPLPEDVQASFRARHCTDVEHSLQATMNELALVREQAAKQWQSERWPGALTAPSFVERN